MTLPHDGVYTRLGVSSRHGVGVFAIVNIAQGEVLFRYDRGEVVWLPLEILSNSGLSNGLLQFYTDFGVVRDGLIGVPTNFNNLTPGWYVNEPGPGEAANVAMGADFEFFTLRDIAEGEEITAVYAGFSDPPHTRSAAAARPA